MIATLLWKNYRDQRGMWIGIAAIAFLLIFGLGMTAQGGLYGLTHDQLMGPAAFGVAFSLLFGYGAACGAMLLAGEKEGGTLDFLDAHLGKRRPVWESKLALGTALVIGQALWLALLMLVVGLGSWHFVIVLPLLAFDALAWGMLGGACYRTVFAAVLVGIALLILSWLLTLAVVSPLVGGNAGVLAAKFAISLAALGLARRIFCEPDVSRRTRVRPLVTPSGPRALLWLSLAQGRTALLIGLAACLPAIGLVFINPLLAWPPLSLLIGLLCGLAVFGHEQVGKQDRFLGAQRLLPGRVWLWKALFWAGAALLFTLIVGGGTLIVQIFVEAHQRRRAHEIPRTDWLGPLDFGASPWLFLSLWVVYGFCFGQLCALLTRRTIVALVIAGVSCLLVAGLWAPSLIAGGLSAWTVLPIPLLLLLCSRLAMWPWFSGRLLSLRPILLGAAVFVAAGGWLAGSLAYRAFEIPDVDEPFDMRAFNEALTRAAQSPASLLMPQVLDNLNEQATAVSDDMGPPRHDPFPPIKNYQRTHADICRTILGRGWPEQDEEIARWLDRVMEGKWAEQATRLAELPPGLWLDPRRSIFPDYREKMMQSDLPFILAARALQLQAGDDVPAALAHVDLMLALSRQYGHYMPYDQLRHSLTVNALAVLGRLLDDPQLDAANMQKALAILQEHESKRQSEAELYKAYFLVQQNNHRSGWQFKQHLMEPQATLLMVALQVPWEAERQRRLGNAVTHAKLALMQSDAPAASVHGEHGLPEPTGPTLQLNVEHWDKILRSDNSQLVRYHFRSNEAANLAELRALQIQYAVTLYADKQGKLPARLQQVVPGYLAKMPLDPFTGRPLSYALSKGEEVEGHFPDGPYEKRIIPAGSALIWYEKNGRRYYVVAPRKQGD